MALNVSGYIGVVTVNGVDMHIQNASATESTGESDSTTTADYDAVSGRAYGRSQPGVTRLEGSFELPLDTTNDIWPGQIKSGQFLVNLILTKSGGHFITCPSAFVASVAWNQGGIGGMMGYTVNFKSQGIYTIT